MMPIALKPVQILGCVGYSSLYLDFKKPEYWSGFYIYMTLTKSEYEQILLLIRIFMFY